jgi:purine nucleoside phosphorylase
MPYAIYKAGVPSVIGTKTAGSLNTNSVTVAAANNSSSPMSAVAGTATGKGTIYKAGVSSIVGLKQAGSLNANGVLTVAPGKNTPQS